MYTQPTARRLAGILANAIVHQPRGDRLGPELGAALSNVRAAILDRGRTGMLCGRAVESIRQVFRRTSGTIHSMTDGGHGVNLVLVEPEDRERFVPFLDDYLRELAGHRVVAVGATSAAEYRYLDGYFGESGRHAFFIVARDDVAGFALIRGPKSTGAGWQVAEFYIAPHHRRSGIGQAAITSIWNRFPGQWELHVHARNAAAIEFWGTCMRADGREEPSMTTIDAPDGPRLEYQFRVERPAGRSL